MRQECERARSAESHRDALPGTVAGAIVVQFADHLAAGVQARMARISAVMSAGVIRRRSDVQGGLAICGISGPRFQLADRMTGTSSCAWH